MAEVHGDTYTLSSVDTEQAFSLELHVFQCLDSGE